jgi:4-hydroxybenzoate polyprenyltransferase
MIPEEIFKRRRNHNNTPESVLLIITNYIVVSVGLALFSGHGHINWFFWVVIAFLALYNFYTIRRNSDDYGNRITVIAYLISLIALVVVVFLFKGGL